MINMDTKDWVICCLLALLAAPVILAWWFDLVLP